MVTPLFHYQFGLTCSMLDLGFCIEKSEMERGVGGGEGTI